MPQRNCSHGPQFVCGCCRATPRRPSPEAYEEWAELKRKAEEVERGADDTRRSYSLAEKAADAMLRFVGDKRMTSRRLK